MRYITNLVLILGLTIFSGCSFKEIKQPMIKYTLLNSSNIQKSGFSIDKILKIDRFKSLKFLKSNEIWYQKPDFEMNSYAYSYWNGDFSLLVEKNIAESIYQSHIFKTVFQGHSKIKPDLILEGEILQALQTLKNGAEVTLKVRLYLVYKKSGKLIGSKEFEYNQKCKNKDAKGAVDAYNEIIQQLDKDVISWIKQLMKKN